MKKTILAVMALVVATAFFACDPTEKTKEELLCQKKGWELYTATSIPAYTNNDGVTNENLFKSYWLGYECELDDILYFYETKSSIMKEFCEDKKGKENSLGNWRFIKDYEVLEFHLPYFFDAEGSENLALLEGKVLTLDENTLSLRMHVIFADDTKSDNRGKIRNDRGMKGTKGNDEFDFTFTYKVAK